jgi:hypothetical protein
MTLVEALKHPRISNARLAMTCAGCSASVEWLKEVRGGGELLACPDEPATGSTLGWMAKAVDWLPAERRQCDGNLEERRRELRVA